MTKRIGQSLRLSRVTVKYGSSVTAVDEVSFDVQAGSVFTILGASGSGKTSILGAISGDLGQGGRLEGGRIFVGTRDISSVAPDQRGIARVYQQYTLWNHMTVFDNIAFPLQVRRVRKDSIASRVRMALSLVRLDAIREIEKRKPLQLSGGQQQRVALARALVFDPPVLLLDEPLGSLDRRLREQMRDEIAEIQRKLGITLVYVTHDHIEALSLSDTIGVLDKGRIVQVGRPAEIYQDPARMLVADSLGESNLLAGHVVGRSQNGFRVRLDSGLEVVTRGTRELSPGKSTTLVLRPERLRVCNSRSPYDNILVARVSAVEFLGGVVRFSVEIAPGFVLTGICLNREEDLATLGVDQRIRVGWNVEDAKPFATAR